MEFLPIREILRCEIGTGNPPRKPRSRKGERPTELGG
jgi:hypothetical protein